MCKAKVTDSGPNFCTPFGFINNICIDQLTYVKSVGTLQYTINFSWLYRNYYQCRELCLFMMIRGVQKVKKNNLGRGELSFQKDAFLKWFTGIRVYDFDILSF